MKFAFCSIQTGQSLQQANSNSFLSSQDDPAMLLRESMGVGADSTQKAFHSADINSFFARKTMAISRNIYDDYSSDNTNHVLVSVDPAGGGASAFAISSLVQLPTGAIVVCAFQFPSVSPAHSSLMSKHDITNASGAWQECRMKHGINSGSTRSAMSLANVVPTAASCSTKCFLTSSSLKSAYSSSARMQASSAAPLSFSSAISPISWFACFEAGVSP